MTIDGSGEDPGAHAKNERPKVVDLVVNLKCEMMIAANSIQPIGGHPPGFEYAASGTAGQGIGVSLNLRRMFQLIHYVGESELELDVKEQGGLTPSAALSLIYSKTASFGLPLSLGWNDTAHRNITIDESIDFDRLVPPATKEGGVPDRSEWTSAAPVQGPVYQVQLIQGSNLNVSTAAADTNETPPANGCAPVTWQQSQDVSNARRQIQPVSYLPGSGLSGGLKLESTLATAMEATAMSDIGAFSSIGGGATGDGAHAAFVAIELQ